MRTSWMWLAVGVGVSLGVFGGLRYAFAGGGGGGGCFVFEPGNPGCECWTSDCGGCIVGTKENFCEVTTMEFCITQQDPKEGSPGYALAQREEPCFVTRTCNTVAPCSGQPCVPGAPVGNSESTFILNLPGTPCN